MKKSPNGDGNVVSLKQKRAEMENKLREKMEKKETPKHVTLGQAVLAAVPPILFTRESLWRCQDNLWSMLSDKAARQWLDVEIEKQVRILYPKKTTKRLTDETRNWLYRNPDLRKDNVEWDGHGKVITRTQWIDFLTGNTGPVTPELYATRRIECEYTPKARCPLWLELLGCMFDKETITLLQEICGMALINDKPKGLSKALVLWGPSDTGKSVIISVMSKLISRTCITTEISLLENAHGTSSFVKNDPWVLHEAFEQGKWHFSAKVKAIIEGRDISINQKNKEMESRIYKGAVFWATNHAPSFKEATKALVNRMVIIACKCIFKGPSIGVAKLALKKGYSLPDELIIADELPGLLNWALEGLEHAWKRGGFRLAGIE